MSHFVTVETQLRDIAALKAACRELGLDVQENTTARGYAANRQHGDFVIRLKGPYDIAVNRKPDGTCGLTADWWQGHVAREVGANFTKLMKLYSVHKVLIEAKRKGHTVRRQNLKDGSVKLTVGGV
jgi:hypothetical protein